MRNRYDLFDSFIRLSEEVRLLGGIIQNGTPEIPEEALSDWNVSVDECLSKLNHLKVDVNGL